MSFAHLLYSPAELAREVGENARSLRLSKNLSRKTLALKSGVSESSIKRFETSGAITLEALILLATALGNLDEIPRLFTTPHPESSMALKNAERRRGTR